LNDLGHDPRFLFPYKLGIESALGVFVAIIDGNFKTGDGMAIGGNRAGRSEGRVARLSGRL
jgi:hypothetical protein